MSSPCFDKARALIDKANSEDPNRETAAGAEWPKELLYSHRMSDMLGRYAPDADDAMKLAARAQHIQRWKLPRGDYPLGRKGYHQWRAALNKFHAGTVAALLAETGYDAAFIQRVTQTVGKKSWKINPDSRLLEDVAGLVFLERYLPDFANKHPEYDEHKWIDILGKIWKKLSSRAQQFILNGHIEVSDSWMELIRKAITNTSR